jgi:hypothetical protein
VDRLRPYFAVKDVLPDVIAKIVSGNIHDQIHLENAWNDVAGSDAIGSVYTGFKNGCVFVVVDTPARLYQWKLKKPAVLRRLSEICPEVNNLSFKIGKVK